MSDKQQEQDEYPYYNHNSKVWALRMRVFGAGLAGVILILWGASNIPNDDQFWNVFILGSVTWLILVTAWVQIGVTQKQWKAMRQQLRAMKTQTDRSAIADRAYFGVTPGRIENVGGELRVEFTFTNGGKTPAWDFRAAANVALETPVSFQWRNPPELQKSSYVPAATSKTATFNAGFYEKAIWLEIIQGWPVQVDGECRFLDHTGDLQCVRFGFIIEYNKLFPRKTRYTERYQEHYSPEQNQDSA
ncbi:MAG: hypothetical protein DMF63_11965 [Acidobacteria bacterium]|nr:MAG: hypothetical protein DMF63_11965 [Acidobacteriota bacterium]